MTDRTAAPIVAICPALLGLPAFANYTTNMEPTMVGMKVVRTGPPRNMRLDSYLKQVYKES